LQPKEQRGKKTGADIQVDMARTVALKAENSETEGLNARRIARSSSDISHPYNTKITDLIRRNAALEDQLAAALASKDQAEKNLSLVISSREQLEKRLANKGQEAEMLKEKIAGLELAQEESNNLSNTVHADNVRLEREVAFLKAIADESQKARRNLIRSLDARWFWLALFLF
jgi:chromosome segregation ATPase